MELTQEWDKTFALSDKVNHEKVTFTNLYGITLAANLYRPKAAAGNANLVALAVAGPFGAVKEQASGLYAQHMAEQGYLAIAFDPSFIGESGGEARNVASPDINTEDFMAAVDYLSNRADVNPERVGIIGICGWGGIALNAAAADPRVKATLVSTMYDMTRVNGNGYFDADDSAEKRNATRHQISAARTVEYAAGTHDRAGGCLPYPAPDDAPQFVKDYSAYYKTPRGYHTRSLNSNEGWNVTGTIGYANARFLVYTNEIESAVLMIHGEKAHSLYFGKDAYAHMMDGNPRPENKEFYLVPGATHCDLYDGGEGAVNGVGGLIPWDKVEQFFARYL
ncbi:fermentation-respiration switch protein FrsA (DUF1100 family) [Olsenella profusa DSM 13989]|uniref:alpha/beta hydrolase n=1 Tax=Olsenella profusa TaxID=138595 RepID=UPI0027860A8A|nr:alpha/beta hydrolase [Olsenella profusa]MDP9859903.1 fermentation-respiration switch protein FrsA (DUF1100 family) [Olsenella profusa DSM 13989]